MSPGALSGLPAAQASILAGTAGSQPSTLRSLFLRCCSCLVLSGQLTHMRTAGNDIARLGRKSGMGLVRQEQRHASCITCGSKVDAVHRLCLFCAGVEPWTADQPIDSERTDIKTAAGLIVPGASFKKIAASKSIMRLTRPPPSLVKKIFGIGPSDGVWPPSRLIFPYLPCRLLDCHNVLFLLYTAVVTPAVIAFHWLDEECAKIPVSGMHIQQAHCCWHQPSACPQ